VVSTVTVADRPTRSGDFARSASSISILTGTRCTTLIQLPDAFCAGSKANAAPVPAAMPLTWPVIKERAAVEVALDLGRLADAQMAQLHFLEIGIHHSEFSGSRHQCLPGLHMLANCTLRSAT